jgi:dihydrofolate reductase
MLNLIFCVDKNGLFGRKNKLPWNFKEELKYFKNVTTEFNTDTYSYISENKNNVIVMGYNTWISLTKKLPNRINVVISTKCNQINQNKSNEHPDYIYKSFENFLEDCKKNKLFYKKNIFIIGGKYLLSYVILKYNKFIKYIFMNVIQYSFPQFIDDVIFNFHSFNNFKLIKQSNQQIYCLNLFDDKFYNINFNNYINSQFDINSVLYFIENNTQIENSIKTVNNYDNWNTFIDNSKDSFITSHYVPIDTNNTYNYQINSDLYNILEYDIQNIDDFCEDCEESTNQRCKFCKFCKLKCLFC